MHEMLCCGHSCNAHVKLLWARHNLPLDRCEMLWALTQVQSTWSFEEATTFDREFLTCCRLSWNCPVGFSIACCGHSYQGLYFTLLYLIYTIGVDRPLAAWAIFEQQFRDKHTLLRIHFCLQVIERDCLD